MHYCSNDITAEYLHWLGHQVFQPITATAGGIKYQLQLKAGVILELALLTAEIEMLKTCNVMLIRLPIEMCWSQNVHFSLFISHLFPYICLLDGMQPCMLLLDYYRFF